MSRVTISTIVLMSLLAAVSFADGPPIRNGSIYVPYVSLRLSEEQVAQAGVYRYVKLTSDQKAVLHRFAKTRVPDLLQIITAPYNDCACGLLFYGLWARRTEVQVPKEDLEYLQKNLKYFADEETDGEDLYATETLEQLRKRMDSTELNIDISGRIYQKGILVTDLGKALAALESTMTGPADDRYLFVNTPPLTGDKVVAMAKSAFLEIKAYFSKKGYGVSSYFESEYITNELEGYDELQAYAAETTHVDIGRLTNGCSVSCGTSWQTKASSSAKWKDIEYPASDMEDSSLATAWVEGVRGHGIGETITFDHFLSKTGEQTEVNGLLIANGFQKSEDTYTKNARVKSLVLYVDGHPTCLIQLSDVRGIQKVTFDRIVLSDTDELVLKIVDIYGGLKYQDTAISLLLPYYEYR